MKRSFIVLVLILLGLAACQIEKPHLPSWDIELNVPLMNEKFMLSDLVDNEFIYIDNDDVLYLQSSGDLDTPDFGDVRFNIPLDIGPVPLPSSQPVQQSFSTLDLDQGYRLSYGKISSGAIEYRFSNVDEDVQEITISFDGLYSPDNQPLVLNFGGNQEWQSYALVGSHMGTLNSGVYLDEIAVEILVDSSLPIGTVAADLELRINDRIGFDVFQGSLHSYVLESPGSAQTVEIEYPYGMEQALTLQEASLVINVTNPVGFPAIFEGELYARNDSTGATTTIQILADDGNPVVIDPAIGGLPSHTEIEISQNISQILQIMPHVVEVRDPKFTFGYTDPSIIGTTRSLDQLDGSYTLNAPFKFLINSTPIRLDEPVELEISADNRERIRNNALEAGIRLQMINTLPIAANASIYISDSLAIDIDNPDTYLLRRDLTIQSGVDNPGYQELELMLNQEEMLVFDNPKIYMQLSFSLNTGGEVVTITASPADFIQIRGMLSAQIHVED